MLLVATRTRLQRNLIIKVVNKIIFYLNNALFTH